MSSPTRAGRVCVDDLSRWDGRLPVALVGTVVGVEGRRRAFRDFARRISGDPAATIRHEDGRAPVLLDHAHLLLSSASRDGFAAFAAAETPVGIDVERVDPAGDIPLGVLHPAERDALALADEGGRAVAFAAIWACKEAYLKALGTGLARDPATVRVALAPAGPTIHDGTIRVPIHVEEHRRGETAFVVALATLPLPGA